MTHLELEAEQLVEAVRSVWMTTLGLDVADTGDDPALDAPFTGSVGISGRWQGAITMQLPSGLARRAAAAMFMIDEETTTSDEMQDALGELVNQVAGIVRPLVSDQCVLSLPTVASGDDSNVRVLGTKTLLQVPLACGDEPLVVTLLRKNDD
ncbi:MAG: chemotaxis protein CheX [Planctomycetota bacterium]|jgi:chemotaxis protein CheX